MSNRQLESRFEAFKTFVAILIALGLGFIVVLLTSKEPGEALKQFVLGPFSQWNKDGVWQFSTRNFGQVIEKATPLIFTGVAICVMFQANMFNMIAEGSFLMGGVIGVWVITLPIFTMGDNPVILPEILWIIIAIVVAGITGVGCASIPAIMKAKWNANEVVASLMMNSILLQLNNFFVKEVITDPTAPSTTSRLFPENAQLTRLTAIIPKSRVTTSIFVAIITVVVVYYFMYHTKWGYEIRVVGQNASFAQYSGINVMRASLMAQFVGGAIAAIGGILFILSSQERYGNINLPGYGFDGILVAVLAKNNPIYVPIAALAIGYLRTGGDVMNAMTDVPLELVQIMTSLVIMLIAAEMLLSGFKHKLIVKNAHKLDAAKEVESK